MLFVFYVIDILYVVFKLDKYIYMYIYINVPIWIYIIL